MARLYPTAQDALREYRLRHRDALEWSNRLKATPTHPEGLWLAVRQRTDEAIRSALEALDAYRALLECAHYDDETDPADPDNAAVVDAVSARLAEIAKEGAR